MAVLCSAAAASRLNHAWLASHARPGMLCSTNHAALWTLVSKTSCGHVTVPPPTPIKCLRGKLRPTVHPQSARVHEAGATSRARIKHCCVVRNWSCFQAICILMAAQAPTLRPFVIPFFSQTTTLGAHCRRHVAGQLHLTLWLPLNPSCVRSRMLARPTICILVVESSQWKGPQHDPPVQRPEADAPQGGDAEEEVPVHRGGERA